MAVSRNLPVGRHIKSTAARIALASIVVASFISAAQADWTLTPRNAFSLSPGLETNIRELSGVTYLGPTNNPLLQRFAAIQDENGRLIEMHLAFAADGSINSATAVASLTLPIVADYEGIAFTGVARNTVFVSDEEDTAGIYEHNLITGARLQTVSLPSVFDSADNNLKFESLTRSADGATMWTANESALTVDGPAATQTQGTTVRLQKLTDNGSTVTAGQQFAYQVDPIHAGSGPIRSGLSDLALLPDNTLLAVERSFTSGSPFIQNRIYQVDFAGATDISTPAFATGLDGKTFSSVGKTLLWSGISAGNLEGITVGHQLSANKWVLLGVIDNSGEGPNPIVSFELSKTCNTVGDYNCSGVVNGDDYKLWAQSFGLPGPHPADGNGDGTVNAADYVIWRNSLLESAGQGGGANAATHLVPEPAAALLILIFLPWIRLRPSSRIDACCATL